MDIANFFFLKNLCNTQIIEEYLYQLLVKEFQGKLHFLQLYQMLQEGDHFHTRKIERFAVIKGKALIQLRRVGTNEIHDFYLYGDEPAYVDMPIWHTHNIKNIGDDILYTNFWINETYNSKDADTFFEEV